MAKLYWLSEPEFARSEPLLPRGRRGAHRVDDRRVISGIVHMVHSDARWRDCPADYGPHTTIYNRFNCCSRQGIWLEPIQEVRIHEQQDGLVKRRSMRRTVARRMKAATVRT